eukprot:TRINITY_DN6865_c0_g1_i1.p1 TRINITY_DN6865_c0_g1~~TRINITY_DN6865_c0_g1_i1.p1  ORF type:complete len:635 (+),score=135.89 TRINITY_DN6865_c0_g1_i1:103-2007(+)
MSNERVIAKWLTKDTEKGKKAKPVGGDRVTVGVRVRPMLGTPDGEGAMAKEAVAGQSGCNTVAINDGKTKKKEYPYDYVFTNNQYEIYDCIGKDMLRESFNGYNVCLFAYGQTGSGKTYTVQGLPGAGLPSDRKLEIENEGILPRLIKDLFNVVEEMLEDDSNLNIKVTMSLVEVYNEKVRDLLPQSVLQKGQEPPSLDIIQTPDKKIEVLGLTKHTVLSAERVRQLLSQANKNRQVAETKMNECSSRSHTIIQLYLVQQYETPALHNKDCESCITIVDLAGSERQSKTEAQGSAFNEAKHINKSLLQLGMALNSFSSKGQTQHVPLRDSKLTRLLSESFGGNSKTWMLATVAPSLYNWSESVSTLNYASNAKFITNHAKQNRLERAMEMKDLKERNKHLEEQLDLMKKKTEMLKTQIASLQKENDTLAGTAQPLDSARLIKEERTKLLSLKNQLSTELDMLHNEEEIVSARPEKALTAWPADSHETANNTFIGRAKVSLKNIIEQSSKFFELPLSNESGINKGDNATLMIKIYPVDAKGAPVTSAPPSTLLGQRVDFVVHIISAANIPEDYSRKVYCKYVYKWAEKDTYKTNDSIGINPEFDFRKRFAFSKMNVGLVEYFRSDNVITFEVIGV